MPTAVKDGVLASSIIQNFSGDDFPVSAESINTLKQGATFIIDPRDGISRLPINKDWTKTLLEESPVSGLTPPEPNEEHAKQVAHLVNEGLPLKEALEKTKPGSASEGPKTSWGAKTETFIVQRQTPSHETATPTKGTSSNVQSSRLEPELAKIQQIAENSPITWREAPLKRFQMLGGNVWSRITGQGFSVTPTIGPAPSSAPSSSPYQSSQTTGIGVTSQVTFGPSPRTAGGQTPTSSTGYTSQPNTTAVSSPQNQSAQTSHPSGSTSGGHMADKGILGSAGGNGNSGGVMGAGRGAFGNGLKGIKNGIAGRATALKGGITNLATGAIKTAKTLAGAIAGNPVDIAKTGLMLWNNKERLFKIGAGIAGGGLLYLYSLAAPWLSALSPAALAGAGIGGTVGFLVGGPIGMAIGIPLGAYIGANWAGIAAGVGNALASISGAIAGVGSGLAGVVAAITSSAAAAIGVLSALTIGGAAIFVAVPEATKLEIWGQSEVEQVQLVVQKTATPNVIANDQPGAVVYKITLVNDSGLDIPIKINDRAVKVYGKAATKTITMPNPTAALPTVIPKTNNSGNPLVITYQPFTVPATIYNDSQIVNTVVVEADDPQTKQKKSYSADATVVIGSIEDDHPYGFPSSGWLSSVDTEPCTDHQGVFYGIAGVVKGGLDIVGAPNSVVISTLDGTVTAAKWDESSYSVGGYVYITSKSGNFVAGFLHMNTPTVKVGDEVKRGQPIGTIYSKKLPTTGGPHVHYQVIQRVNGQWINAAFSDSARAGACLADPSDSPEANISPRVLIAPSYTQAGCSAVPRVYVMKDSVQQEVTCVK